MYQIHILDAAATDLRRLDRAVAQRIVRRIQWLAANLDLVKHNALVGQHAGLLKFRVGDYRVLYEIIEEEQLLIIHMVGHRRDIYRR